MENIRSEISFCERESQIGHDVNRHSTIAHGDARQLEALEGPGLMKSLKTTRSASSPSTVLANALASGEPA